MCLPVLPAAGHHHPTALLAFVRAVLLRHGATTSAPACSVVAVAGDDDVVRPGTAVTAILLAGSELRRNLLHKAHGHFALWAGRSFLIRNRGHGNPPLAHA